MRRKSKSSASSSLSQSSTASSARLRTSAKKAALSVEAAALKTRQIRIAVELAKAEAEERVYCHREEQSPLTTSSQLPTSHETKKESTVDVPECQENLTLTPAGHFSSSTPCQVKEKETVEVSMHQTEENQEVNCSPLNRTQTPLYG